MALWQMVVMVVLILLPVTLLLDLHPRRERLTSRGRPLPRTWERGDHPDPDAAHGERHHP